MKNLIITILLVSLASNLFAAIDTKFLEGYELQSVDINTPAKEHSMSFLSKDSIVYLKGSEVFITTLNKEGNLSNPIASAPLQKLGIEGTVAFDSKLNKIYFSKQDNKGNSELYESTFTNGVWSEPKVLFIEGLQKSRGSESFITNAGWSYAVAPIINFTNPTIAKKGSRIYFTSSSIENGFGGTDIWYIDQKDEKTWLYPVNAGESINTTADEDFAFVYNDTHLYFASKKEGNSFDIFKSEANGNTWTASTQLDAPYNLSGNDYNLIVKDGIPLLISDRNTGNGDDIFAFVKLPEPEPEPEPIPEPIPEPVKEFKWTLFLFDFDKDVLTDKFVAELDALAIQMKDFPEARFEISGYTDSRGSDKYNDALSLRRANRIKALLIEKGFKAEQFEVVGNGKRKLNIPNASTEDEHAQNRRVEVKIINPIN